MLIKADAMRCKSVLEEKTLPFSNIWWRSFRHVGRYPSGRDHYTSTYYPRFVISQISSLTIPLIVSYNRRGSIWFVGGPRNLRRCRDRQCTNDLSRRFPPDRQASREPSPLPLPFCRVKKQLAAQLPAQSHDWK